MCSERLSQEFCDLKDLTAGDNSKICFAASMNLPPLTARKFYQLYQAEVDSAKPHGAWSEFRILITPEKTVHWVNGTKYFDYVKGSEDWNKRVAASKFVKLPKFGKATKGHIALQDHGNVVLLQEHEGQANQP